MDTPRLCPHGEIGKHFVGRGPVGAWGEWCPGSVAPAKADSEPDFDLECEACGNPVPYSEAVFEYADKGSWWEQSWAYHREHAISERGQ